MANTTITNLPLATSINGTEQIPAVQSSATVRLTVNQLVAFTSSTLPAPVVTIGGAVSGGTANNALYVSPSGTLGQFPYGTGVLNAIQIATGTNGAMVLLNGDAGTPTSLVLTNATGTPASIGLANGTGLPVGGILVTSGTPSASTFLRGDSTWAPIVLTVGTTAISGATNGYLLYNNGGTLGSVAPTAASLSIGSPITGGTSGYGLYVDASSQLAQFAYGTGVRTALGVNVGSAGAPVLFNGAGGTPSSLTLTSATGLPVGGISATGTPSITTFLRGDGAWASVSGGSGTVTSVSVTTANGVSGTVANATTTPAISLTLGVITPTSVNGLTLAAAATGFTIAGGTTSKTLTVSNTLTLAGTDASTLNIGAGGTLGSLAFLSAAPAGTLTGTVLNATVVTSSLTSVGTIGTGVWQGTAVGIAYGGTGQTTTALGTIVVGASGSTTTNLAIGTTSQVLTVVGGTAAWATPATSGTVTSVSVTTANGVSGTVATATTTPAISLTLGVITPTSVNGLTLAAAAIGFTVAGGTTSKTLTVNNSLTLAGTDSTVMTFPPASASIGYLNIPQNSQGGNYTLVLADSGKHIYTTALATITIPAESSVNFAIGTAVTFVNSSASATTIAITTDTMRLSFAGTTGSRTLAQYGMATAIKVASGVWYISGTGLT